MPVPSINQYSPWPVADYRSAFDRIKANFGSFITTASNITNVPKELIYGKIAVESQGFMNAQRRILKVTTANAENDSYVGLMQIGSNTVNDVLLYLSSGSYSDAKRWVAPQTLRTKAIPVIQKYLPEFNEKLSASRVKQLKNKAFLAAKTEPEFNILAGTLYFYILIANPKFADNQIIRLDKIVAAYNTGPNYRQYATNITDTAGLIKKLPAFLSTGKVPETRGHILKLMGVNGAYDLLINKKYTI